MLGPALIKVHTNLKIKEFPKLDDPSKSIGHTIVDLGDDAFTRGRAHPMIDQSYRLSRLAGEVQDPEVGIILLDVVLGFGCNEAPGVEIAEVLKGMDDGARKPDQKPILIAGLCGTYGDPQGYFEQKGALESAGVYVMDSNENACALALEAHGRR